MRPVNNILRAVIVSATLAMALPGVALAGQQDRAEAAIAEARGKISAGNIGGTAVDANSLQMRAKASLNQAESLLAKGKKAEAISAAQQAGMLADQAIAMANGQKAAAADRAVGNAEAAAASAQQSATVSADAAAAANARADLAAATPPAQTTTTTVATVGEAAMAPEPAKTVTTATAHVGTTKAKRHRTTVRKTTTHVAPAKPPTVTQSTTVTTSTPR